MENLPADWREFIELLNSHQVKYLVVGGFAVAYHGHPRMTEDIDFFIEPTPENAVRVEQVLQAFGFGSLGLTPDDFTSPDRVVQLGYPPNRIDLITSITGSTFEEAWAGRVAAPLDGIPTNFISRDTLVRNKLATGRSKDKADVRELP